MVDFHAVKEVVVNASPEAVFGIVSDFSKHRELAGSGELVNVRLLTQGPTDVGTTIEADESIGLGDQHIWTLPPRQWSSHAARPIPFPGYRCRRCPFAAFNGGSIFPPRVRAPRLCTSAKWTWAKRPGPCSAEPRPIMTPGYGGITRGADVIASMEKTLKNLQGMV